MEQDEFLGQLRMILDSLQMQDVDDYIDSHGEITAVTYTKWNIKIRFADNFMVIFDRWDFY